MFGNASRCLAGPPMLLGIAMVVMVRSNQRHAGQENTAGTVHTRRDRGVAVRRRSGTLHAGPVLERLRKCAAHGTRGYSHHRTAGAGLRIRSARVSAGS